MNIYDTFQLVKLIKVFKECHDHNVNMVFTDDGNSFVVHIPEHESLVFE